MSWKRDGTQGGGEWEHLNSSRKHRVQMTMIVFLKMQCLDRPSNANANEEEMRE